jgi:hypothetical protein
MLPTLLALAGGSARLPVDRYIDGIDQSALLLTTDGLSHRKFHYYWLMQHFSGCAAVNTRCCSRRRATIRATQRGGRLHRVLERHTYPKLFKPVSGSEGAAQLPDAQARVRRGLPARHAPASGELQALPAQAGDGPSAADSARELGTS